MFDQTILENLLCARPFPAEQDVYEACHLARIHDQILSLPDGYRSCIGKRGVRVSGGELERQAIARVIIRRPHIVVPTRPREPSTPGPSQYAEGHERRLARVSPYFLLHIACQLLSRRTGSSSSTAARISSCWGGIGYADLWRIRTAVKYQYFLYLY